MDREELRLAAQICARLDGLPLAIELAAARLRTFSTKELAGLLEGGLDVLGAGGPGAEPRHRTLRAAIEWSYQLLEEPERAVFRRFSVLRGGGDLEAALAVCADPEGPPPRDPQQATGALVRLVDRSLLSPAPGGQGTRYRMLELVREYAAERLVESGEEAGTRARQADWYSRSVTGSHARPGRHAGQWAKRLDTEHDNLRAALTWYLGEGQDPERARDTAAALWRHWWGRGMMSEGREWLRRSLAGGRQEPSPGRVRGLRAAAVLARHMHDHDEARRLGREALEAARAIGDEAAYPACLNGLCATAHVQGDLDASLRYGEESVAWAERLGDRRGVAAAYANLATTLRGLGRLGESEVIYLRALSTFRQSGDRFSEAVVLNNLAQVARRSEQPARSRDLARQALAVYQELQFVDGELDILGLLACLEVDEGRPEAGLRTLAVTERERQRTGYRVQLAADREARGRALAAATLALGEDGARAVRAAAAAADVDDLVTEFLAGTPGHIDDVGPPSRGRGTPRPYLKPDENWVRTKYRWKTT
jgi:tetratricopeptide (TPR) repeat protein